MRKIAISVFVAFHLLAIGCWTAPVDSPLIGAVRGWVRPYMLWSGLFQSWDMFAPLPAAENAYIQGVVITHDGRLHTWKFPRMEQLRLTERYSKERYRKFAENLTDSKYAVLWPDVARDLARRYREPGNPPEIVMLIRYWSSISPLNKTIPGKAPQEQAHIFYERRLEPGDLR